MVYEMGGRFEEDISCSRREMNVCTLSNVMMDCSGKMAGPRQEPQIPPFPFSQTFEHHYHVLLLVFTLKPLSILSL
jgi:hypothetical protein